MVVEGSGYSLITGGILVSAERDSRKPYKKSAYPILWTWMFSEKQFRIC